MPLAAVMASRLAAWSMSSVGLSALVAACSYEAALLSGSSPSTSDGSNYFHLLRASSCEGPEGVQTSQRRSEGVERKQRSSGVSSSQRSKLQFAPQFDGLNCWETMVRN
eukprot:TRINITY_DN4_c0_g1_i1.p2 TRINITY_DN4_c0_g1~~TRINITY_DN4_c0_g1_i1.p2  ORF type:complete len:109 (+),score=9.16 TRINITY_DN4_c0_g1_i1:230-556(+)